MTCGTPLIGVNEYGVPESIVHEQTGFLIDRDPAKFAGAIQHLFSYPDLALEYSRKGCYHVQKNWTWDKSVSDLEGLLQAYAKV